jgi:hypothetical protein
MTLRALVALVATAAILATLPVGEAAAQKTEKISGYAEFKKGDTLIVEGQRVVARPGRR